MDIGTRLNIFALATALLLSSCSNPVNQLEVPQANSGLYTETLILPGHDSPTEVTYEVKNGLAIIEGDIILGEVNALTGSLESQGVAISGTRHRWIGGVVPYVINVNVSNQGRENIAEAVAHWAANTEVNFIPRTSESDYVEFTRGAGLDFCASAVGRQGGQQTVELTVSGDCSTTTLIHEMGHAIGLWHEQSRADRDRHVQILWANILADKAHNFSKHVSDGSFSGAYDYGSIMHYRCKDFSANGKPTIKLINPPAGMDCNTVGNRFGLSTGDVTYVNTLYRPSSVEVFTSDGIRFVFRGGWSSIAAGNAGWKVGDFNGDGRGDIFRATSGGIDVFISDGTKFNARGRWTTVVGSNWTVGDFNGDNKDDVFRVTSGGLDVFTSDGTKFNYRGKWNTVFGVGWTVGDFNGDNKDDVYRITSGGLDVFVSDGIQFNYKGKWTTLTGASWTVGDFGGDSKDDIFRVTSGGLDVFISDGTKFNYRGKWTTEDGLSWTVGDFGGDSREDVFRVTPQGVDVFTSDGAKFNLKGKWLGATAGLTGWRVGDFNGDLRDDIMRHFR